MRANPALSDGAFMESRAAIEQAAQAIDDRLIAVAALPRGHREAAIAAVEPEVAALEASVASLAQPSVGSVIAGATAPEQVRQNAEAVAWVPGQEELAELDEIFPAVPKVALF